MFSDTSDFKLEVRNWDSFWEERTVPTPNAHALGHGLCIDYALAPRSVIEWLMGNDLVARVYMNLDNPEDTGHEYPQLFLIYLSQDQQILGQRATRKILDANPAAEGHAESEYAVTDQPPSKSTR
jgi:hypothetical protein